MNRGICFTFEFNCIVHGQYETAIIIIMCKETSNKRIKKRAIGTRLGLGWVKINLQNLTAMCFMNKISFTWAAILILSSIIGCTQAPLSDEAKITEPKKVVEDTSGQLFPVDLSQSKIEWIGTKVSGYHTGTVQIKSGGLKIKNGKIEAGKFTMDMNSILVLGPEGSKTEDNEKLQKHLKSADFFEVSAHPEANFEITDVKPYTGIIREEESDPRQEEISEYKVTSPTHTISGNLTIKGITKNIEFPARVNITPSFAEAIAKFNIDRTLWNVIYPGQPDDLIRKDIHLGISLMATPKPS